MCFPANSFSVCFDLHQGALPRCASKFGPSRLRGGRALHMTFICLVYRRVLQNCWTYIEFVGVSFDRKQKPHNEFNGPCWPPMLLHLVFRFFRLYESPVRHNANNLSSSIHRHADTYMTVAIILFTGTATFRCIDRPILRVVTKPLENGHDVTTYGCNIDRWINEYTLWWPIEHSVIDKPSDRILDMDL